MKFQWWDILKSVELKLLTSFKRDKDRMEKLLKPHDWNIMNEYKLGYRFTRHREAAGVTSIDYGECCVNAVVTLTGLPYKKVRKDIGEVNARDSLKRKYNETRDGRKINKYWNGKRTFRFGTNIGCGEFKKYAKSIGLTGLRLPKTTYLSMSEVYEKYGDYMAVYWNEEKLGHIVAIVGGELRDYLDERVLWFENMKVNKEGKADYFRRQEAQVRQNFPHSNSWTVRGHAEPYMRDIYTLDWGWKP